MTPRSFAYVSHIGKRRGQPRRIALGRLELNALVIRCLLLWELWCAHEPRGKSGFERVHHSCVPLKAVTELIHFLLLPFSLLSLLM